jgi:RNA polymerase sigma-70 factor (ECF subfamily)
MPGAVATMPSNLLLDAIERCRRRLWALCYRMTGSRTEADDLAQEAIARGIERESQLTDAAAVEGWLFRIATTVCLDHLRREKRVRRVTELVDPLDMPELAASGSAVPDPEAAAIRRDDVRFAVVVALQTLSPRQRAAVVLHDVCDRPLDDVAAALGSNSNAMKALLHRGRAALSKARGRTDGDVVADATVVERFARAIEAYAVDELAALCTEDVWGVVDGGAVVRVATKPTIGRRAVARRWANAARRLGNVPVACSVRRLSGEFAVIVAVPSLGDTPFATVHLETARGLVQAIRVVRDPQKLAPLVERRTR